MKSLQVVGGTCNCVDHIIVPPSFPGPNEKHFVEHYEQQSGGVAANAIAALSRWGIDTAFVGFRGSDEAGQYLLREFQADGIDTHCYFEDTAFQTTQTFLVIDKDSGARTALSHSHCYEGTVMTDKALDSLFNPRLKYLLLDTHHPIQAIRLAQWAKKKNLKIILDAGTYKAETKTLLPYVDYMIAPDDFFHGYAPGKSIEEGLHLLSGQYAFTLCAATIGEKGCKYLDRENIIHISALDIPKVVDATGAGDLFHAGFVYGLCQGWEIKKSLKWATISAGLQCTSFGGRAGIATLEKITHYYDLYIREEQII